MDARQAIEQAKKRLVDSRDLSAILARTGSVRVSVLGPTPVTPEIAGQPPSTQGALFVTFTNEDTMFGKRLMADFQGHKEFAA